MADTILNPKLDEFEDQLERTIDSGTIVFKYPDNYVDNLLTEGEAKLDYNHEDDLLAEGEADLDNSGELPESQSISSSSPNLEQISDRSLQTPKFQNHINDQDPAHEVNEMLACILGSFNETRAQMREIHEDQVTMHEDQVTMREGLQAELVKVHEDQVTMHEDQVTMREGLQAELLANKTENKLNLQQQTSDLLKYLRDSFEAIKKELRQEMAESSSNLKAEIRAEQECLSAEIKKVSGEVAINSNLLKNEINKMNIDITEITEKSEQVSEEIAEVKSRLNALENVVTIEGVATTKSKVEVSKEIKQGLNNNLTKKQVVLEQNNAVSAQYEGLAFRPPQSGGMANLLRNDKPVFEGDNPSDFLHNTEVFLNNFGISRSEAVEHFEVFLKGRALQWWKVTGRKDESWEELKESVMSYWFNKAKLKEKWQRLVYRPHFNVERFVFDGLEIQNALRSERSEKKKIQKVAMKLPSPLKEFVLMKEPKTVDQFLRDIKQIESFQNSTDSTFYYNSKYKTSGYKYKGSTSPKKYLPDSASYNWDTRGNAYSPEGTCVWENRGDHPKKGVKYVNAIFAPNFLYPNALDPNYQYQDPNYQYQDPNYQYQDPNYQDPNSSNFYSQPQSQPQYVNAIVSSQVADPNSPDPQQKAPPRTSSSQLNK